MLGDLARYLASTRNSVNDILRNTRDETNQESIAGIPAVGVCARILSYIRQSAAEVSTSADVKMTGGYSSISSREIILKEEWRSWPVLVIGLVQKDRIKGRRR